MVGPLCETGDFLALERPLPSMKRGDLLAIYTAVGVAFYLTDQAYFAGTAKPRP